MILLALVLAFLFGALWIVETRARIRAQEAHLGCRVRLQGRTASVRWLEEKVEKLNKELAGRAKWAAKAVEARKALEDELERMGEQLNDVRDRYSAQIRKTGRCDRFLATLIQNASEVRDGL